ncbi:uncharacterized protein LOC141595614 [Silene latifolia]|uniref:uncharacterized protein LOC141595614 n=1 Tax=Silene latifolia TaxID=37657 RepID=UPI003D780D8B
MGAENVVADHLSSLTQKARWGIDDGMPIIEWLPDDTILAIMNSDPWAVISDGGSHFINRTIYALLKKYGIRHKVAIAYHPQTNGQVEVSNRQIKAIVEHVVNKSRKDWSDKLNDHRARWALKELNYDLDIAGNKCFLQLNELDELRMDAYENARFYKEITKQWHDSKIMRKEISVGDKVLLFNSRFQLFTEKFKSRWSGLFEVVTVYAYGSFELKNKKGECFKVNGQRVKYFYEGQQIDTQGEMELEEPLILGDE